ncbi:MAG: hypothetical protein U1A23_04360 [Candidatus Sungbacteria bacterium]|nr:hypothetical protein [bacterium]MDZ4286138.1 hypothetical protein [Candidatus Sungbacteria bacterium]
MKQPLWKSYLQLIISFGIMGMGFSAFAQGQYPNPLGSVTDIVELIKTFLGYLTSITIPLAGFAVIIAGLNFVIAAASGNPSKLTTAKTALTWVLIGTGIVVAALVIATAIVNFLKLL